MKAWTSGLAVAGLVALAAARAWALDLGDKAPEIDVTEWAQGGPVTLAEGAGTKVFVLVFWKGFEEDSKKEIPHLIKVSEKYKDKVQLVGITDEKPDEVKTFITENKVTWPVGIDASRNTNGVYTMATKVKDLPHAYIVNKEGQLAWHGATGAMDSYLDRILAGTYDAAKMKQVWSLRNTLGNTRNLDKALALCDEILALEPIDELALQIKWVGFLQKKDGPAQVAFIRGHLPKVNDHAPTLNDFAWKLATHENFEWRDIALAHKAIQRAIELTEGKDASFVDTHARVLFETGLVDMAVAEQKKAISLEPENEGMKKTLAYYEAAAKLAKEIAPPPAPTPPGKKPPPKKR